MTEYPAANVCIYCSKANVPLHREHIIPLGLNGDPVLPRASCDECAKITGRFEGRCLRTMFGPYRVKHGFKSRRRKDRKKPSPLKLYDKSGREKSLEMPLEEHPAMICVPFFGPPGILIGGSPSHFVAGMRLLVTDEDFNLAEAAISNTDTAMARMTAVDLTAFTCMLAKIGHAFAYAETKGFEDGWEPLLRKLILGKDLSFYPFVGGTDSAELPSKPNVGHLLTNGCLSTKDATYLHVDIRLFANAPQMPVCRAPLQCRRSRQPPRRPWPRA